MNLNITLDHSDSQGAIFTMEVVGDEENAAAGTYHILSGNTITLTVPESPDEVSIDQ